MRGFRNVSGTADEQKLIILTNRLAAFRCFGRILLSRLTILERFLSTTAHQSTSQRQKGWTLLQAEPRLAHKTIDIFQTVLDSLRYLDQSQLNLGNKHYLQLIRDYIKDEPIFLVIDDVETVFTDFEGYFRTEHDQQQDHEQARTRHVLHEMIGTLFDRMDPPVFHQCIVSGTRFFQGDPEAQR